MKAKDKVYWIQHFVLKYKMMMWKRSIILGNAFAGKAGAQIHLIVLKIDKFNCVFTKKNQQIEKLQCVRKAMISMGYSYHQLAILAYKKALCSKFLILQWKCQSPNGNNYVKSIEM